MGSALYLAAWMAFGQAAVEPPPQVTDMRLQLVEFASHPDIVTPVGLDVDAQGRVLVVESHTHFPPAGYQGPKADRIRLLADTDGDGRADRIETYYEGLRHTMNLAIHHDGSVFVATRSEILRLRDADGDGKADKRTRIAHLETAGDYPHNGLSGFAFDLSGHVYFGFGENLGADYRLIGSDGRTLSGGGEGGNVYRCHVDGSELVQVATGFWNPFHVALDAYERLFAVDNDPDSRPPCRLLYLVPEGDYGYRFRNGRKGTHPFTAWNGELPGTLPMASGTGEAPSGIAVYESDNLPADYLGSLLVTSWGDHRIDRFGPRVKGAAIAADAQPVVIGGENFRPVGIAVGPDGAVYFSDWVDKSYELHGKGRIWKLSARRSSPASRPTEAAAALRATDRRTREAAARRLLQSGTAGHRTLVAALADPQPRTRALAALTLASPAGLAANRPGAPELAQRVKAETDPAVQALLVRLTRGAGIDLSALVATDRPAEVRAAALAQATTELREAVFAALDDVDPFIRHAAYRGLERIMPSVTTADAAQFKTPGQRQAFARRLRASGKPEARQVLPELLGDDDAGVRFLAIQWVGEERLADYRSAIEETLASRANSRLLFESCLATLDLLDGVRRQPGEEWRGEQYVVQLLTRGTPVAAVRVQALRTLRPDHPYLTMAMYRELLADESPDVRLEAIRSLRDSAHAERFEVLMAVAGDSQFSEQLRAEAIVGLTGDTDARRKQLVQWASEAPEPLAIESLRGLRGIRLTDDERQQIDKDREGHDLGWVELADVLLQGRPGPAPPMNRLDAWIGRLDGPANAEAGQRVFFHPRSVGCARCHEYEGRGGGAGPELTAIGRTLGLERLVESIVQPSREVAPHFVPWLITTTAGQVRTGLLVGEEVDGTQRYVDGQGREFRLKPAEIDERRPSTKSIMPDDMAAQLTAQEFRDLIAFLLRPRT